MKKIIFLVIPLMIIPISAFAAQYKIDDSTNLYIDGIVRGYYLNDQRIEWSGLESTFGAEADINSIIERDMSTWKIRAEGEFYLNQPYGRNILSDEMRNSYKSNFQTEIFTISKLNIQTELNNFTIKLGKGETPFGRTYFQTFSNSFLDSPFIRTESILWRETGLFINYTIGLFSLDAAIANGEKDKDTNSSKAAIGRIGVGKKNYAFGVSAKYQDGIGSGVQKTFKNHYGIDFMARYLNLTLSGEAIYDEYGFYRNYNENEISWNKSIYYRDIFYKDKTPITGIGGYLNLGYKYAKLNIDLNYGLYYPQKINNPYHDELNHRGIIKIAYNLTSGLQVFGIGLLENERKAESWRSDAKPFAFEVGLQYKF